MPADRLLGTLLRSLQTWTDQQDTVRILGTASSLLTTLNNPLNITLLTSQLLSAPALWERPENLRACLRFLSVYHSAAQALNRHEDAVHENARPSDSDFDKLQLERVLPKEEWVKAIIGGADQHSPRWRHVLVFAGLLLGFGPHHDERLSRNLRNTLEVALVTAINIALRDEIPEDELGQEIIAAVLNYCFPLLSDLERSALEYDRLLPCLVKAMLHHHEGLRSAYFVGALDMDLQQLPDKRLHWPERSSSFQSVQTMMNSNLISSLGPLARLIGHTVEQVTDPVLVQATLDDLEAFSRVLSSQWRRCRLAEVDVADENISFSAETKENTLPLLWKLFRSILFGTVIILRSVVGRMLGDAALARDDVASELAVQMLSTIRNLYFISSRMGSSAFSQHTFVYLTSMDILVNYPQKAQTFLECIKPVETNVIPAHPYERCMDLFFLNTAEHFTLVLPLRVAEELLLASALPYLAAASDHHLLSIFEAAHSVVLAVFSAPQNADLTFRYLSLYVGALFKVFPENLSARQFRLAFRTLLRLTSPPAKLALTQPLLPAILLDLLLEHSKQASTIPMQPHPSSQAVESESEPYMSEQAVLVMTVIETLTQIRLDLLDEWLPLAAGLVHSIEDPAMRQHCQQHFWHVLVDGEMDPERSGVCHAWWSTGGGREMVLSGVRTEDDESTMMSGGLPLEATSSKL